MDSIEEENPLVEPMGLVAGFQTPAPNNEGNRPSRPVTRTHLFLDSDDNGSVFGHPRVMTNAIMAPYDGVVDKLRYHEEDFDAKRCISHSEEKTHLFHDDESVKRYETSNELKGYAALADIAAAKMITDNCRIRAATRFSLLHEDGYVGCAAPPLPAFASGSVRAHRADHRCRC